MKVPNWNAMRKDIPQQLVTHPNGTGRSTWFYADEDYPLDQLVFLPRGGRCPECNSTPKDKPHFQVKTMKDVKLVYTLNWPFLVQSIQFVCTQCPKPYTYWLSTSQKFLNNLEAEELQPLNCLIRGSSNGISH